MLAFLLPLLGLPSVIGNLLGFATPFLTAGLGFLGWYLKEIWEGLKDIFDNLSTIITVATLMAIGFFYGMQIIDCPVTKTSISTTTTSPNIWSNPFANDGG